MALAIFAHKFVLMVRRLYQLVQYLRGNHSFRYRRSDALFYFKSTGTLGNFEFNISTVEIIVC